MKLLLVEDEERVSSFIKRGLEEEGHRVQQAFDGKEGLRLAIQEDFDLIILDVVMPGMSGIELCDVLKNQYKLGVPILMLTALGATDDIVLGLETGADDYLSKPFKFKELLARIHALIRRAKITSKSEKERLTVLDLEMDLQSREVRRAGVEIRLTAREFRLLEFLLRNKNRVVSRTQILEQVWGIDFDMGTNVIDVYINYLRKKIDRDHEEKIIRTVIGMGYIIKE